MPDKNKVINSFKKLSAHFKRNAPDLRPPIETSPFLIGNSEVEDKITIAKQKSWIIDEDNQISFI